jgi:hypothetical protein
MSRLSSGGSLTYVGFGSVVKEISGPDVKVRFEGLRDYFEAQLAIVSRNLAQSGANIGKENLRKAETDWGAARMAGNYGGVRFKPYGRSAGREDTGFMMNSLSAWVGEFGRGARTSVNSYFGWTPDVLNANPYIVFQATGYRSKTVFDPQRTAASGIAKFKEGSGRLVRGADPLSGAISSIKNRAQSAYSAAWNEAVKIWEADGFKGGAGKWVDVRSDAGTFFDSPYKGFVAIVDGNFNIRKTRGLRRPRP